MSARHHLSNKVVVHFDMLATVVKNEVGSKICGGDVIAEEPNGNLYLNTQINKKLTKPLNFGCSVGSSMIFDLYRGVKHSRLFLGPPEDKVRPQENSKTSSGATTVRTSSPTSIL